VAQQGHPGQPPVLLGQAAAEALAAPGRDDKGYSIGQRLGLRAAQDLVAQNLETSGGAAKR
jgi:hypothetical protein